MPPGGGTPQNPFPNNRPPGSMRRPPGSGRHYNPYGPSGWRRRAPSWLIDYQLLKPKPKKTGWIWVLAGMIFFSFAIVIAVSIVGIVSPLTIATAVYSSRYESLSLDKDYSLTFETTRIYDRKGVLLYEKQPEEGLREYVTYDKIPRVLVDATTAAEDPSFFDNQGVDPYAIGRAVYINLSGQGSSGASTITQQVARLLYLPPEQRAQLSPNRKIDEAILAIKLTDTLTKEAILEKYFNNIYYGNLAYGIQAASLGYFGKEAKDLDLAEASMLAGLPQAPSAYDPTQNYELARKRQKIVLDLMVKYSRITQPEADTAFRVDLASQLVDRRQRKEFIRAPHFVNYILQQLQGEVKSNQVDQLAAGGLTLEEFNKGGFDIYTTIDIDLVDKAQSVVKENVDELKKRKASNAALVAIKPGTGEILSMVGSTDYNDTNNQGQFNVAVARRQPGSALKPLTYAFAMTKGWTAATVLADVRTEFPSGGPTPYLPQNFDNQTRGPVTLRNALGSSLNIPAVKALQFDGIENFINQAREMGVTFQYGPERYGLTLTLGGGEVRLLDLVGAYSVFGNLGEKVDTVSFLKVTRHDKMIYEYKPAEAKRKSVLSPQVSYIITDILSDNNARLLAFDRNNPLVLDRPAAAKTGTSNDFVDSWTVGYTPDLVVGVWVGNNNNKPMDGVAGSVGAGIVWNDYMTSVYKDPKLALAVKPDGNFQRDFTRPGDVEEVTVCVESGLLPNDACPQKRKELFPKKDVPTKVSDIHRLVKVARMGSRVVTSTGPDSTPGRTTVVGQTGTECIPDASWPASLVETKLFYVYPPELQDWALKQGRRPPPITPCGTYVPPTPTPAPSPSPAPSPTVDPNATPAPDQGQQPPPIRTPAGPPPISLPPEFQPPATPTQRANPNPTPTKTPAKPPAPPSVTPKP
jgi:penicillin-binding protein 1C